MVTTPLPASTGFDPQRLDELQEVTRQYGEYGRSRFGLGLTIFSVWLIAPAVAFMAGWHELGRLLLATGAVVWFPVLQHSRQGYQRHGTVILEEEPDGLVRLSSKWRGLRGFLLWGGLPSVFLIFKRSAWPDAFLLSHGVGYGLGIALVLMTVLGAWLFGRGYRDTTIPAGLLYLAMVSTFGTLGDPLIALGIALIAVLGAVRGLLQHRQFRELERRLLALRGDLIWKKPPAVQALLQVDRVVHEPARLAILTVLATVEEVEFKYLESALGLTKGNLSSHVSKLEAAGYLTVQKTFRNRIPMTGYRITPAGREALTGYRERMLNSLGSKG